MNNDIVLAYRKDNALLIVERDDEVCDPPYIEIGEFVTWHSRYRIGSDQPSSSPLEYIMVLAERISEEEVCQIEEMGLLRDQEMSAYLEIAQRENVILPVYIYDHSGISLSTTPFNDRWDSGQLGWFIVPAAKVPHIDITTEEGRAEVEQMIRDEVQVWDYYVDGDVYGCCLYVDEEPEESCYGFIGDPDDVAENFVDYISEEYASITKTKELFGSEVDDYFEQYEAVC